MCFSTLSDYQINAKSTKIYKLAPFIIKLSNYLIITLSPPLYLPKPHLDHAKHSLLNDIQGHFRLASDPIFKGDGHFFYLESQSVGGIFHFNLERIADKLDNKVM